MADKANDVPGNYLLLRAAFLQPPDPQKQNEAKKKIQTIKDFIPIADILCSAWKCGYEAIWALPNHANVVTIDSSYNV